MKWVWVCANSIPTGAFPIWPHGNKCWQVSCSFCEERNVSFSPPHSLFLILSILCQPLSSFFPPYYSFFCQVSLPTHTHTLIRAHKHCLWEMASVFQLACNGPLTRLASGELGPQQMLLWIGRSSAACRLYWIVIRVELTIHDRRSGFVWEGMLLHQVIFILLFSVGLSQCSESGALIRRINTSRIVALLDSYLKLDFFFLTVRILYSVI